MERERSKQATTMLMWALVAGLFSQNMVTSLISTASVEDQKNYYPPDPHAGSPPRGSHRSPSHGSGGSYGGTPPSHGSHGGTPPSNCGNPPSGHYDPTPAPPSGGGYHYSPPAYGGSPPSTPSTPTIISPPTTPAIIPGTPTIPGVPSPPIAFDPNSPPFGGTCNFWRTHPGLIWGLFGYWGTTVGGALGLPSVPGFGANLSLQQALSNTRSDGLGALYREGTAALLNSMVNHKFPFTTNQVRQNFVSAALGSNKAAAAQAQVFKLANEGRLKPRA